MPLVHMPCAPNALHQPDQASSCLCAGDDSLIRISEDKLPGDSLALSMGKVWEVIKDQKDLNLPAHKVSLWGNLLFPLARMCACQLPGRLPSSIASVGYLPEAVPLQGALHDILLH